MLFRLIILLEMTGFMYVIDQCSRPQTRNMKLMSQSEVFTHGSFLKLNCNDGYVLNGPSTIECDNGKWKPQHVDCKLKATLFIIAISL